MVDEVLDAAASWIEVHPRGRDALFEQRLAGPVERAVGRGSRGDRTLGCHAVALLVRLVVAIVQQVTRGLVGAGEPGSDHDVRGAGGQRQRDVARVPHTAVGPHVAIEFSCCSRAFDDGRELRATHAGHHPGGAHRARPDTDLDDGGSGVDQIAGSGRGHDVPGGQRHAELQAGDRLHRVEHPLLMAVRGVDDQQIDTRLGEVAGLGGDVTVDADRGRNAQPALAVDCGGVDAGPHRTQAGEHTGEATVGLGEHRHIDVGVFEQVEHLARIGTDRSGDEIRGGDVAYPGEPVYAAAGRLRDEADGAVLEEDDGGAVGPLVNQGERIGDRGVRRQRDRGVHHEVAALDEVDGVPDRHQRKVLGQNDDSAPARHRLGHAFAGDGGHVGHHHRDRRPRAVHRGQVDVEARRHLRAPRHDENVVVGQVIGRPVAVEELHRRRVYAPVDPRVCAEIALCELTTSSPQTRRGQAHRRLVRPPPR